MSRFIKKRLLEIASHLPTNMVRCISYRLCGIKIGKNTYIARNVKMRFGNVLGNNVRIESDVFLQCASIGDGTKIDHGAFLIGVNKNTLRIGKHSYVGYYNILDGSGGLEIGDYVHIGGPAVGIWTHSSIYQALQGSELNDPTYREEGPVRIEDNVWVGNKVTIYQGVKIGHHSVILPNSVVNKEIPPFSVVGGVPVKVLKKIRIRGSNIEFVLVDKI